MGLCPFCNLELETVAHLFLHCSRTWRHHIIFRNKVYEEGILVDNIKRKIALWLKACYDLKEYSEEDIKRCIQGIRKLKLVKLCNEDSKLVKLC
ncbi:hypothetical protein RHMOL_Rhmol02G0019000 [Rhododendron molle]|uniref:Uncharacterized protein n=1 Tax=Rhododendron molle TaxID=49168 RepID=A0ACC0PNT2_RHOML|nr:hypothetical protein RHMOL_Rhmol02G0019000 [Rhododendron molle]